MLPLTRTLRPCGTTLTAARRHYTKPPSYFADHLSTNLPATTPANTLFPHPSLSNVPSQLTPPPPSSSSAPAQHSDNTQTRFSPFRDISIVICILALSYFAIDNYKTRALLEQKVMEQSMAHVKGLAVVQNNFNNQRKKREVMTLNERRAAQKREMKMVYHVAMLRKQLVDLGAKPVEIDEAVKEFEKNVKMENSISNVSGTALWVVDESPMKPYVPNTRDYETKK